ncbi:helix-turn-helix domain-containing protein [Breznakia pachnodae]|uniref:Transcriptional regulator with XRE-family HTH domain n=1 Tax=Breznakia pachnodae TaxID=265178 RepID=A0ABU0E4M5_9FIRM|nr:helix-turn-helix transcriptional regulator [Breznakia pachnodae]MDQ0361858.1 transcriptional regulator with XRE-family HTH domain [Breznakia pachnodae]
MIYRRLRDLREDKDLTQENLAEYLQISQRTYSRYETGESSLPIEIVSKLADFYNTTIDYLVNRTNKK